MYTSCNAHEPYCHLWPVRLCCIFPLYLINSKIFEKKNIEYRMCILISLQLFSETFLILRKSKRDMIKNVYCFPCKAPLLLSDLNEIWIFSTSFWKILKYQISLNPVQWEPSCSIRTDGQIHVTKLIVAFELLRTRLKSARSRVLTFKNRASYI